MIVSTAAVVLVVVVALILARQGATTSTSPEPSIDVSSPSGSASLEPSQPLASPSASATPSPTPTATPAPTATPTATSTPSASSSTDLTGTWAGTSTNVRPDQATGDLRVTWTQEGSDLVGTMVIDTGDSACGAGGAVQGVVTGDQVAFSVADPEGIALTGTLTGAKIGGTFTRTCDASNGTFSLERTP
jgi:hypothetical protein